MIKKFVCVSMGVAAWAVFAAGSAPKAELVGSVEFASFSDYQKKIVDLGTTINNPIVSMMAVPVIQSNLTENFGSFRPDSPMKLLCYADVAAVRKAGRSSIPVRRGPRSSLKTIPRRRRRLMA